MQRCVLSNTVVAKMFNYKYNNVRKNEKLDWYSPALLAVCVLHKLSEVLLPGTVFSVDLFARTVVSNPCAAQDLQ